MLLMRNRLAVWSFGFALGGLALSTFYTHVLSDGAGAMGATGAIMSVVIWAIAIALFFYASRMVRQGALR